MRNVEMLLDSDELTVTFNATRLNVAELIAKVKETGYSAVVVGADEENSPSPEINVNEPMPNFFTAALERAGEERKPLALNFTAEWCLPCKRMKSKTFPDTRVTSLLDNYIFLEIDADQHPAIARKFNVSGLPTILLLTPDEEHKKKVLDFQSAEMLAETLTKFLDRHVASRESESTTKPDSQSR